MKKFDKIDVALFVLLLVLSVVAHVGRLGSSLDGTVLTTDPSNYASMAAAMAHPEVFAKDPAYRNAGDYNIHATIITPLVSMIAGGENYGLAYLQLTGIQFFLHHLTFYILGLVLLKQRWHALAFTIIMGQVMWIEWGTFWGNGFVDHVPRSNFTTLYALFVAAALHILQRPRYWPVFMFSIGLMVYIHAISTLPAAIGFWLGFAVWKPKDTPWHRHVLWLIFSGCCFLIPLIPFLIKFLSPSLALSASDITLLREIVRVRFNPGYTEYWAALKSFFTEFPRPLLFSIGIAGFFVVRRYGNEESRRYALQFALWTVGMLLCVALFFVDKAVAHANGSHESLTIIIRVFRYSIFFCVCLGLMAFHTLWQVVPKGNILGRCVTAFAWFALLVGLLIGGQHDLLRTSAMWFWNSLDDARYEKAYARDLSRLEMLEALQKYTEKDALIFHGGGDRAIRYKALRPLVYSWRDPSIYYFAKDIPSLITWYERTNRLQHDKRAYIALAFESGADYLLTSQSSERELLLAAGTLVWENDRYVLIKLKRDEGA